MPKIQIPKKIPPTHGAAANEINSFRKSADEVLEVSVKAESLSLRIKASFCAGKYSTSNHSCFKLAVVFTVAFCSGEVLRAAANGSRTASKKTTREIA